MQKPTKNTKKGLKMRLACARPRARRLGVRALRFQQLGSLRSGTARAVDDHCVASCADWYGNARPIFWRGRVFALMGYELVEGSVGASVRELRRVDFLRTLLDTAQDRSGNVFNNLPD